MEIRVRHTIFVQSSLVAVGTGEALITSRSGRNFNHTPEETPGSQAGAVFCSVWRVGLCFLGWLTSRYAGYILVPDSLGGDLS